MIANGELGHTLADSGDDTCTIGHGDAPILRTCVAGDDAEVVVVERVGMNPYLNLARLGRTRGRHVDQAQVIQTSGMLQLNDFHESP
ncbi:hypothetical protein D3C78_1656380 [compost metagenome]